MKSLTACAASICLCCLPWFDAGAMVTNKTVTIKPSDPVEPPWVVTLQPKDTANFTVNIVNSEVINGVTYVKTGGPWYKIDPDGPAWSWKGGSTSFTLCNESPELAAASVVVSCRWSAVSSGGEGGGAAPDGIYGSASALADLRVADIEWVTGTSPMPVFDEISWTVKLLKENGQLVEGMSPQFNMSAVNVTPPCSWEISPNTGPGPELDGSVTATNGSKGKLRVDYDYFGIAKHSICQSNLAFVCVDKLQYRTATNQAWIDAPTGIVFLATNAVDLLALRKPTDEPWPAGKPVWGGCAGGSGMDQVHAALTPGTVSSATAQCGNVKSVTFCVLNCDIAMDGNRDDSITFGNTNDNHYLFWVNDDVDVISSGEEDDAESGTANCNDSAITCKRDLEDFTRLHIKVDDTTANLSGITYFLKFENISSGSPSVNIFEAVGESSAYLSDTNVANQQIQKTKLLTVTTIEQQLSTNYIKTGNQVSPFILEGKSAGKGDLTVIVKKDGNEICKKAVNLDLRPIAEFYEKYVVTISTGDNVNTNDGGNANSTTYTPENDEYVLQVHGWNMADWEKDRWTETVFKRLWWQKYKGHVGGFQWPTYTGSLTYDASEIRAWRSAQALHNRITNLNASYSGKVRVIAHSMGNVVMGETLRLFSSSVVHTYIAAQAAIPAHCYDNTISNYWTGFDTPNIYARYSSGLSPDTPYLATNSSHAGAMVTYFNTNDYALGWWETGNEMKPDFNYWYTEGDANVDSYAPGSGDRFYYDSVLPFDERTMTIPDDRFEIFARIVESRSRALGREPSVAGFGTARNLKDLGYNEQHYSHSREFRSNVADEWSFWDTFFQDAWLTR